MKKFICKECGYKFENENKKNCPYCGKKETEEEKNAEELIEEVKNILE
jgi:rubrerythrin